MLRALVFDFDGLIVDTETPIVEAYAEVHARHGFAFDMARFVAQIGHADYSFDPWTAFGPVADKVGLENERRVISRARTLEQPVLPGVVELLEAGKAAGLKLAVASNSDHPWVEGNLQRLGLHSKFDFFACRGDVPNPKPEPDIYRHAVNQLGLRPCHAVALEDSDTGLKAARRAGLFTVGIPNPSTQGHHVHADAHWLVSSMAEVSLAELNRRFFAEAR